MRSEITKGWICHQDRYGLIYKIAKIVYEEFEDGNYVYTFYPLYQVIDFVPFGKEFQGIPGLNLDLRLEKYERKNRVPVFISERSPSENRENLWELLQEVGMDRLNRLEWLKRTNTRYFGDSLFVRRIETEEPTQYETDSIYDLSRNQNDVFRKVLDIICYGDNLKTKEIEINDSNRKEYFNLFYSMYLRNLRISLGNRKKGIEEAKRNNKYQGRPKKDVNSMLFNETVDNYYKNRITVEEACETLGISRATFYRRIKDANFIK